MKHCPKCGNNNVQWEKSRLPRRPDDKDDPPKAYFFMCHSCNHTERVVSNEPDYLKRLNRWSG